MMMIPDVFGNSIYRTAYTEPCFNRSVIDNVKNLWSFLYIWLSTEEESTYKVFFTKYNASIPLTSFNVNIYNKEFSKNSRRSMGLKRTNTLSKTAWIKQL